MLMAFIKYLLILAVVVLFLNVCNLKHRQFIFLSKMYYIYLFDANEEYTCIAQCTLHFAQPSVVKISEYALMNNKRLSAYNNIFNAAKLRLLSYGPRTNGTDLTS